MEKKIPFNELILSWNAKRPLKGKLSFFVSVKHNYWSRWDKLAEWSHNGQQTFVNSRSPFVHTKHVKIEVKRGFLNLLSLTVLKKFLEPKYLTINNTFYQIKDEYYNKQFYESIKSLQKQIIDILEKKINCL